MQSRPLGSAPSAVLRLNLGFLDSVTTNFEFHVCVSSKVQAGTAPQADAQAAAMFVRNSAILAACAAGAASAMPLPHGAAPLPHRPVAPCSRMQCQQPVASARPDIVGAADARGPCAGMPMRLRGGDRKYCIAGNWKMNPATLDEATKLATEVRRQRPLCRCESIRGRAAAPCERACCMQHDGAVTRQKRCGR